MIKRTLFEKIKSHLDKPEITLIIGPRQAGKTTIMRQLQNDLDKNNQKTLFFSLDNDSDKPYFESQNALIQRISIQIGQNHGFVFIDEIQRKVDAGLFLKGIYDQNLPYKFIVSGSGSIELKEKIHESLAGRKRLFELYTLSFDEFANFRTGYRYEDRLEKYLAIDKVMAHNLLNEYLNFGGYPKVVLAPTSDEKTEVIKDIYQTYLEKDIAYLLNIQKTESLTNLVRILASQTGNLVNISEISSTLGIAVKTVNDYLWYLEKTFIIERVTPYFKNVRKEITKTPVIYFVDLGMKNYAQRQFGRATLNMPSGFLFENFVFLLLKENLKSSSSLHFWRTKDKAEVDFIIDMGNEVVPVEVKYSKLAKPEVTRSFRSFLIKYHPQRSYIVHLGERFEGDIDGYKVSFISFYESELFS